MTTRFGFFHAQRMGVGIGGVLGDGARHDIGLLLDGIEAFFHQPAAGGLH